MVTQACLTRPRHSCRQGPSLRSVRRPGRRRIHLACRRSPGGPAGTPASESDGLSESSYTATPGRGRKYQRLLGPAGTPGRRLALMTCMMPLARARR